MHKIFVYGTLRSNCDSCRSGVLFDSEYLGLAKTKEKYALYINYNLPILVTIKQTSHILGELYTVSDEILRLLDKIEHHPNLYKREEIDVLDSDDVVHKAWVYFFNQKFPIGDFLVKSGDYFDYLEYMWEGDD